MSEYISQTKAIIAYLRQGYGITSLEALNNFWLWASFRAYVRSPAYRVGHPYHDD